MPPVKTSGLGDRFFVGGVDLSGDTRQLNSIHGGVAPLEVTDITQGGFGRIFGLRDGGIDWTSYFDKQANQSHLTLRALPYTDTIVSYLHGTALGAAAASMVAKQINYDPTRAADGMLTFGVNAVSNAFGMDWGTTLTAGLRTDGTATSPATGVDGAASSAFGGQFYLHVTAFTGTSVTVTIQDSADNSAFAAIASPVVFTAATGATFQRIAITGTVRRYLRAITTGTFSNAVFAVNACRNDAAVVW